jgi:hypothetical protein
VEDVVQCTPLRFLVPALELPYFKCIPIPNKLVFHQFPRGLHVTRVYSETRPYM